MASAHDSRLQMTMKELGIAVLHEAHIITMEAHHHHDDDELQHKVKLLITVRDKGVLGSEEFGCNDCAMMRCNWVALATTY